VHRFDNQDGRGEDRFHDPTDDTDRGRAEEAEDRRDPSPFPARPARLGIGEPAYPRRRPDADPDAGVPADRAAARDGQCWPFRIEEVSAYDARGPGWYWNNFSCGEHTGTHFDAPIHWISGRDLPNNSVDTIPPQHFVAPACVIDCSVQATADPDYLLTVDDIERFEAAHGRIPEGAWLLMRTDWSKRRDPEAYQNFDEEGQHTPGPSAEAVRFLVEQRNVLGFGSEAIGTDAGQGFHLRPPYPCHYYMHGAGRYGLQCLANLDQLPPTGAVLLCPPLKIEKGSGSPLRVLALVEDLK
jgi:kynurenine formamidase